MNKTKKLISVFLLICGLLAMNLTVFAASELPQTGRKGSINVTIRDTETKDIVKGGSLKLCQIASVSVNDWNFSYEYTEAFSGCGQSLADIESEDLADSFAQYAAENKISGEVKAADSNGNTVFSNLPLGLYLVMQDEPADGYESIRPFLISVPMKDGDSLIYDVDASPKGVTADKKTETPGGNTPGNEPGGNTPGKRPGGKTVTGSKLPQTGQLWWPVLILAVFGVTFFRIGWSKRK